MSQGRRVERRAAPVGRQPDLEALLLPSGGGDLLGVVAARRGRCSARPLGSARPPGWRRGRRDCPRLDGASLPRRPPRPKRGARMRWTPRSRTRTASSAVDKAPATNVAAEMHADEDARAVDDDVTHTYHSCFMSRRAFRFVQITVLVALRALGWRCSGAGCAATDDEARRSPTRSPPSRTTRRAWPSSRTRTTPRRTRYFSFVKQKFPFSKYAVLAELALADTQFARGNYQEAIDAYKTFARLHPTHEKVEDGYVAFKIGECYVQDMPGDWFLVPPAYEKDQTAVRDAYRELSDFLDKYPDSQIRRRGQEAAAGRAAAPDRARGLRGALLPGHAGIPRRPSLRLEGGAPPVPRVGARGGAAAGAGRRPTWRWATRARARETFTRVVQRVRHGAAGPAGASCTWSSSQRRYGDQSAGPKTRRQAVPRERRPMDDAIRRAAVRAAASTTRPTSTTRPSGALVQVLRENHPFADVYHMLGVIYPQKGRLSEAQAMFERGAAHQPRLHRGGPQPGGHLQRPGEIRARPRRSTSARWRRQAARRASWIPSSRGRSPTCTPRSAPPTARCGLLRGRDPRVRAGAGAVPDASSTSARGWATPARDGRHRRRDPRVRAREEGEPELGRRRGCSWGSCYYAAGRRDEAASEWRGVLALDPDNRAAQMYLALLDPARPSAS